MEVTRVFDLLPYQLEKFPKEDALTHKVNGAWVKYSIADILKQVNQLSLGFIKLGITKDDKVAIIAHNRPEWVFTDFALQQLGAVSVPIYPTLTADDIRFIFGDSEVKLAMVSDADLYNKAKEASVGMAAVKDIYTFLPVTGAKNWEEIKALGQQSDMPLLEEAKSKVTGEDLLTLIYTSGTTGTPKGVMLTHNNLISNYKSCIPLMPVDHNDKALSFLPLCHVYERMMIFLYTATGVSIYFAESMDTIGDNLKEVQPQMFTTVPRLLEKVYERIVAKGSELTGIKKKLFFWSMKLGNTYDIQGHNSLWYKIQLTIANVLIFNKWREALGGNIKAVVSGSAALQPRLAHIFWAARIKVMEGYGLTETSPVICVNRCDPKENRIGTVGPVIPGGVEVKIAADGEILTRGPHIMKGYYKRPDLTAEAIDSEGWFHTGDIGEFIEGKYLKITDRKKEMFKTSGGKYIAPQLVENKFKECNLIEQIMVVGEGQKFPAALIVPAFNNLKHWCEKNGIVYTNNDEMICKKEVLNKFQKEIDTLNESFAQYEKIKKFELLPQLWTIEAGELTPTLKVKRKVIAAKYKALIDKIYS